MGLPLRVCKFPVPELDVSGDASLARNVGEFLEARHLPHGVVVAAFATVIVVGIVTLHYGSIQSIR